MQKIGTVLAHAAVNSIAKSARLIGEVKPKTTKPPGEVPLETEGLY